MKNIKKTILKKVENRARTMFPESSKIVAGKPDVLTIVSGLITIADKNSFYNIENDMMKFPVLQNINFRFFKDNPKGRYRLAKGFYDSNEIEARLITDCKEIRTIMHSVGTNPILNPLNPNREISLTSSRLDEIAISKATFAIEEYLVGGRLTFLKFISEINDRDELRKIASYILYEKSERNIHVLALRKKFDK